MREPQEPLFLARRTYRQRRLMDAARLLPWLGTLLFSLPLLWSEAATATGLLYIFAVWVVLIAIAAAFARGLGTSGARDKGADDLGTEG